MHESRYNFFFDYKGKNLAFNSMTCAFAEVDEEFREIMDDISCGENIDASREIVSNMLDGGYLVKNGTDEQKHLKMRSFSNKFNQNGLGLTLAPTMMCNFACPYCYENPENGMMDQEVQDSILKFAELFAERKQNLTVSWYGGEPTLALGIVKYLSEKFITLCKAHDVEYSAYMISNGYELDEDAIRILADSKVTGIQITIDGPPEIHNKRRIHKTAEDTFSVIIKNIKGLIAAGIIPDIRVNVDQTNVMYLDKLLKILVEEGLTKCNVYFGHVTAYTEACASISETCLDIEEYADSSSYHLKLLKKYGFPVDEYPHYPGIKGNYCCADYVNSFVVAPNGDLYKCWNDIGNSEKSVGNIKTPETSSGQQQAVLQDYLLWSPFEYEKCMECEILPICMGGCPYNGVLHGEPECEKWKYSMLDTLKKVYDKYELEQQQVEIAV